jgi:hypothetical protein
MNDVNPSLKALDMGYIFSGLEHLAAVLLLIIITKTLLENTKWFSKNLKSLVWILVVLWSVAVVAQYSAGLYNYIHATRPFYVQARHNVTGL